MRILFYVEPWIEKSKPEWKAIWIEGVLTPLFKTIQGFSEQECFFLVGDAQAAAAERLRKTRNTDAGVITQKELRDVFPDYLAATLSWYRQDARPSQRKKMKELVKNKLNGFRPDIIISFMMPVPFLAELFPEALVLHLEVSGFSRIPYPASWLLDPCGVFKQSFLATYGAALHMRPLPEEGRQFLSLFRKKFLDRLLIAKNPFTREELIQDKPLRYLLLLPLQVSHYFAFDGNCEFASQWDMLCHVLDNVRSDIGVVVTEHSDWESILTPDVNDYLRRTYPNYVYLEKFENYEYPSQFLMHHVDAVATVSSTVGFHGLLWQKPICALGDSNINAIANVEGVVGLGEYLDDKKYKPKDNILYYLLTHCYVTGDKRTLRSSEWLETRFAHWLARFREGGVDEEFYTPIDTPFRVLKSWLRFAQANIPCLSRNKLKRDPLLDQIADLSNQLEFSKPLDRSESVRSLNFANDCYFGSGWSYCENKGLQNWRWIDGKEAVLSLPLHNTCDFSLSITLAPHKDCVGQKVEAYSGNQLLAEEAIIYGKWTIFEVKVPQLYAKEPITKISLHFAEAVTPSEELSQRTGEKRRLSVICKDIVFNASAK